ncbi:MAG TPA: hypothetical protein VMF53_07545 [Alphaproteobacteria bacterium]|nr:hypothetical protein [Alphaproteobacteria bacterium]
MKFPHRRVIANDPLYQPQDRDMQFRLTYEGQLFATQKDPVSGQPDARADHKHEIRKQFHNQLRHVWETSPALSVRENYPDQRAQKAQWTGAREPWVQYIANQYARLGYRFAPLVVEELWLSCRLDILFLRADPPGSLIQSGDIDNRLKTLFDALRIPNNLNELGKYTKPEEGEDPFFCLLRDDKLITHVSVETDVLHKPVIGGVIDAHDARLVITVTIRPAIVYMNNMDFL